MSIEKVYMTDPVTGRCALFDEPVDSGAFDDPNSARNAPLNSPSTNLRHLYFHSDFDYMEVAIGPTVVTVAHAAIAAPPIPAGANAAFRWNTATVDRLLYTHNLGYEPIVFIIDSLNNVIWPGMPIQSTIDGGGRYVSVYVNSTEVRMHESSSAGATGLAATSIDYTLLIFAATPAASGNILFDFDPVDGTVLMGLGKFDSTRRYLQVISGGSPFAITKGRTIDLKNGALRAVRADGTFFEPVPASIQIGFARIGYGNVGNFGVSYGPSLAYNGSYADPGNILVQVP